MPLSPAWGWQRLPLADTSAAFPSAAGSSRQVRRVISAFPGTPRLKNSAAPQALLLLCKPALCRPCANALSPLNDTASSQAAHFPVRRPSLSQRSVSPISPAPPPPIARRCRRWPRCAAAGWPASCVRPRYPLLLHRRPRGGWSVLTAWRVFFPLCPATLARVSPLPSPFLFPPPPLPRNAPRKRGVKSEREECECDAHVLFFPHKTVFPKTINSQKKHFDRISLQRRKEIKLELKVLYANRDGSLCLAKPTARPQNPNNRMQQLLKTMQLSLFSSTSHTKRTFQDPHS